MKFKCNQQTLARALNTVSKAVSSRTTLPILRGILIEAGNEGNITMSASDLDISIKKKTEANVIETGSVVVISKLFGDIIRKLPNEEITIEKTEANEITISSSSSEFKVICLPVEDFPKIGEKEDETENVVLDCTLFKSMVRKTSFAASIDESKGVLVGILTEIQPDSISMVALDGFRMAISKEPVTDIREKDFIISAKIMNEINKIISEDGEEEDINISLSEKKAVFSIGSTEIMLRLLEGEFIKYRDIVPSESTTTVKAERALLLESIERASLLAREGKNNLIKMSINDNLLTITSRSEEGNVKEEIVIDKEGNDLEIGFNSKFVMDVLKAIDDEDIKMSFMTGTSPCVIRPTEGDSYEYLVLPVRIPKI